MTGVVITWIEKELGVLKTDVIAIEPSVLAWAKNTLASVTPIVIEAIDAAVLAAVSTPGTGEVKAAAAVATAAADLASKGIPIVESDLKALVQIGYNALPASITSTDAAAAVVNAANGEIDAVGAKI